jgi:hypothetical protein
MYPSFKKLPGTKHFYTLAVIAASSLNPEAT